MIGQSLALDPLMSLKVLRQVSSMRSASRSSDAETVTAAIVMMGITPFFRCFGPQPTIEQVLAGNKAARSGLGRVLQRSRRAARFALGFAVHRMDPDAAVIHEAALLHDFVEMLLWVHAPELALYITNRQLSDDTLRSENLQRQTFNVSLDELQQALMKSWRLPELLIQISGAMVTRSPNILNVQLAIRLARHSSLGWNNPALPNDIQDIAALLNMSPGPTLQLLHDLDQ